MSVYDGLHRLGSVYAAGGDFQAVTSGRTLGQFSTVNEAKAAITDAAARAALRSCHVPEPAAVEATFARKITTYEFSQGRRRGAA